MIRINVLDEINVEVEGLFPSEVNYIHEKTKHYQKGYFKIAAYKTGKWDGKVSNFDKNGFTFMYLLENKIVDLLAELDYGPDDIEIVDHRKNYKLDGIPHVDQSFLREDVGFDLYDYQVESINQVIDHHKGIIDSATSSGKTLSMQGIIKAFKDHLPSITVVPSMNLVKQTSKQYASSFDVIAIDQKTSKEKKEELFGSCNELGTHIVCTWQTLKNYKKQVDGFEGVVLVDEVHNFGDSLSDLLRMYLNHSPVRVGLTGSVPTDQEKTERIFCHIGGERLIRVTFDDLDKRDIISSSVIYPVITHNKGIKQVSQNNKRWNWEKEFDFYESNQPRLETIAEYIESIPKTNTMILCHAKQAENLSKIMGVPFIDKDVKIDEREYYYNLFEENDNMMLLASYGTSSTGISINRIFRLVLIDVGKDFTKILQGIGRGLRKDGEYNKVEVIDISSDTEYGNRHRRERIKTYRKDGYNYIDNKKYITFGTTLDSDQINLF